MKVHFIDSVDGDWIAMYIDNQKVAEGHSLNEREVADCILRHLGYPESTRAEVDVSPYDNLSDYWPSDLENYSRKEY